MGRVSINCTQSQFFDKRSGRAERSCKKSIPLALWDAKGRSNLFRFAPAKNCAKGRSKEALQLNHDLDRSATKETLARQEHQGTDYQALPAFV